jgi:hypothetical protein
MLPSLWLVICSAVKATTAALDLKLSIYPASLAASEGDGRCSCVELRDTGAVSVDQSPLSAQLPFLASDLVYPSSRASGQGS